MRFFRHLPTLCPIHQRQIYVQFSRHAKLDTNSSHSASVAAALENQGGKGGETVVRAIIDNMMFPVTLEVVYKVLAMMIQY